MRLDRLQLIQAPVELVDGLHGQSHVAIVAVHDIFVGFALL